MQQLRGRVRTVPITDSAARKALHDEACVLRRRISFRNPLLNFDKILFVKREINGRTWPEGTHMCDQYFGFHAKPGGGVFVLEGAFTDSPQLRDLTGGNVCTEGRLKGKVLRGGFLAPELSFDGREILFCFTEAERLYPQWPERWEPHWSPESTFHLFKMNVDGSLLRQLTDGPVNDLHPCFLPNGRVAFISERRGGFGRCHGRPVPCFTLHSMRTDDHYNYGIYLIDSLGNRELLYRDSSFSCHKPISLRPRTGPPVIPHGTLVGRPKQRDSDAVTDQLPKTATAVVMNVYNSTLPFPEGTRIEKLRIIQLLPKTTPVANVPRIGYGSQKGTRRVLGTVPVEADGSAHFEMPVGVPVYFQAIDAQGTAVQSMRSATWAAPGEKLVCKGCHEPRETTTDASRSLVMALQRSGSNITPEVSGSNPFSFPRLVQPVLDRKCVGCHAERVARGEKCIDLSSRGTDPGATGWYTSYNNLREQEAGERVEPTLE